MKIESEELQYIRKRNLLKQREIVSEARSWIGTRFQHQGRLKKDLNNQGGCDCLGFILGVTSKLSINSKNNIPLTLIAPNNYPRIPLKYDVEAILDLHLDRTDISDLMVGDLLLLNIEGNATHLGIVGDYVDGGFSIIHSYFSAGCVVEHRMDEEWWSRVRGVYSFFSANY